MEDEEADDEKDLLVWLHKMASIIDKSRAPSVPVHLLDHLVIGAHQDAVDLTVLSRLGITHVINCCAREKPTGASFYGEEYPCLEIAADDEEDYPILALHLSQVTNFINQAMRATNPSSSKVMIHCSAGMNRSVILAIAYALQQQLSDSPARLSLLACVERIAESRRYILNNEGFRRQLLRWAMQRGAPLE